MKKITLLSVFLSIFFIQCENSQDKVLTINEKKEIETTQLAKDADFRAFVESSIDFTDLLEESYRAYGSQKLRKESQAKLYALIQKGVTNENFGEVIKLLNVDEKEFAISYVNLSKSKQNVEKKFGKDYFQKIDKKQLEASFQKISEQYKSNIRIKSEPKYCTSCLYNNCGECNNDSGGGSNGESDPNYGGGGSGGCNQQLLQAYVGKRETKLAQARASWHQAMGVCQVSSFAIGFTTVKGSTWLAAIGFPEFTVAAGIIAGGTYDLGCMSWAVYIWHIDQDVIWAEFNADKISAGC
jgi:hypothetical protein